MTDRKPFEDIDEAGQEPIEDERDVAEDAPIVGGMGQFPGSGATGISGAGMAPAVTAGTAESAVDDVSEETEAEAEEPAGERDE